MGKVGMASQRKPMRRKAVLTIIKAGRDTRQAADRFEDEHQALTLMGHPNNVERVDFEIRPLSSGAFPWPRRARKGAGGARIGMSGLFTGPRSGGAEPWDTSKHQ